MPDTFELAAVRGALSTWDETFTQVTRNGKNPA